jgi:hypothetical protein
MPRVAVQVSPGRYFGDTPPSDAPMGSVWANGSGAERVRLESGAWAVPPAGYAAGSGAGGAVTQITDATTAVALNRLSGQITTVALTTAAAAEEVFTCNNSQVAATDVVAVATTYAGAGTPIVAVKGVADGSFVIVITNVHASAALNAVLVVNFVVLKGTIT